MAENNKKVSYYNTLIFTIISGVVSLLLLLLLYFVSKEYMIGIIALEIGIFTIIIICIYNIIMNEWTLEKLRKNNNITISFDNCPEYYSAKFDDINGTYCSNEYSYEDIAGSKYITKLYPEDSAPPNTHDTKSISSILATTNNRPSPLEKFYLNELDSRRNLNTNIEKCTPIFKDTSGPNSIIDYSKIPWTSVRSRCETYLA